MPSVPENATIANGVQIGVESTPGTGVPANKLLKYLSFDLDPEINFNRFRAMGAKYASAITPGQDLTTFGLSGAGSYSEIIYALNSNLVTGVITTTDGTAKVHTFTPAIRTEDAVKTYTIEQGGTVRAGKAAYGIVSDLELSFNRTEGVTVSGGGFAQQFQDNIALTGSPTAIEEAPILPTHIDVYVDPSFATIGTTKLTRDFTAVWRSTSRFGQVWPLNSTLASYAAHVEVEPTVQMELTAEYDSQAADFFTQARAGTTRYFRIHALSTVLAGAATVKYALQIDFCGKISTVGGFDDADGVKVVNWTLDAVDDTTAAFAHKVIATNKVTAL
jgi:hypothetical protein